jgi:hypothetical protein
MADAARVGTAFVDIQGDFTSINRQVAAFSSRLGKAGKLAAGLGVVGAGAVVLGKQLYDIGVEFDKAYDKIRIGTGKTGKQLKGLQRDFKAVVSGVPADFGDAGDAISEINRRLGLTGKPLRTLSKQFLELSNVTGTDLQGNIQTVTRLFGDWGIKTKQQPATLDKLFRASQATGIEIGKLSDYMVQFGSPLRQMGFDFDTAAAMFSKFEKEGVNLQTAMPGLRMALKNFASEGKDPATALQATITKIKEAGSAAQANTMAFDIFGTRAGPDLAAAIREGRFDFDELIGTIRGGGDTIRKAGKDTRDFAEHWQLFKQRVMVKLEPLASKVFNKLGDSMERVGDILTDPKLSNEEKFSRIFDMVVEAGTKALSTISSKAGQLAPKAAVAFAKGFMEADIWGKLFLGGAVAAKMLGSGGMGKLGSKMGRQWSAAFLLAVLGTELAKEVKRIVEGHKLGDTPREETASNLRESFDVPTAAVKFQGKDKIRVATEIGDLIFNAQTERVVGAKGHELGKFVGKIPAEMLAKFNRLKNLRTVFRNSLRPLPDDARTTGSGINQALLPKLDQLVDRGGNKSDKFANNVGRSFTTLSGTVGGALQNINENIQAALRSMNVGKVPAFQLKKYVGMLPTVKSLEKQRGGPINIGAPAGDSVPAMLEKGEYVLNRKAVQAVGADTLDRINFGSAPRFQKGGGIGSEPKVSGPDPLRSLGQAGIHKVFAAASAFMAKHQPKGPALGAGAVADALRKAIAIGAAHGSGIASLKRPGTGGSYHDPAYDPPHQAVDLSGGDMMGTAKGILRAFGASRILELFYNPLGFQVDNYAKGPMTVMDHYDHVHAAFEKGGFVQRLLAGGFAGGDYTVKGNPASAAQRAVEEKIMRASDQVRANHLARVAITMAGIQESELGAASSNIFQLTGSNFGMNPSDVTATALYWLKEGYYGEGGGLELSKTMSSPGAIAQAVEGSNFPHAYDPWKGESQRWVDGWEGGARRPGAEKSIPKQIKGTTKGGKTSTGGGTIASGHYKVTTDRLSSFGSLPSNFDACNKELRLRQRELGEYRAAAAQAKDKDVKQALKTNAKLLEIRIAALRKQRRRFIIEAASKKAVAKIAKAANFEAWTNPTTGIFAKREEAYERAQERAEQIIDLEPEVPISGATGDWVEKVLKSYVEGTESPAFARVLGSEAFRRNAYIEAEQFAGNRMEGWRVQIEKLHSEIEFIRALKDSDPKAYARRKDQIPGMQERMNALRADIVKTRSTTLPEWEEALSGVQGHGRTHALLDALPGIPSTEFGGDIFQTQLTIRGLGLKVPEALAGLGGSDDSDSTKADREAFLLEKLRQANQAGAVERAQGMALKGWDAMRQGYVGMFAAGGFIPAGKWGIAGERGPEPVMGPATVVSNRDAFGAKVYINGDVVQAPGDTRPAIEVRNGKDELVDTVLSSSGVGRRHPSAFVTRP